jgi:hypothetical protein
LKSATTWFQKLDRLAMSALTAPGATLSSRPKTPLIACIVGSRTEAEVVDGFKLTGPRMVFISLIVVRNSCQIPQNAVVEALLRAELSAEPELLLGAELPLDAELVLEAEVPDAGVPPEAEVPQADSARARAAVINGVTSNRSRPLVRDVRSMS